VVAHRPAHRSFLNRSDIRSPMNSLASGAGQGMVVWPWREVDQTIPPSLGCFR
jgi:hypothetical protein